MNILVVDDEDVIRNLVARRLNAANHNVVTSPDAETARTILDHRGDVELVISDIRMPGESGIDLLRRIKDTRPEIEVVLMTGYAEIETAVSAVEERAFAYLRKPFYLDELVHVVDRAGEHIQMRRERDEHARRLEEVVRRLETSERLYRTLVEGIDAAVLSVGVDLVVTAASRRCVELLGRKPEELVGTPLSSLRPASERAAHEARTASGLGQGSGVVRFEAAVERPDGSVLRTVELAIPLSETPSGSGLTGFLWILGDGAKESKLRAEAELARDYLDAVRRSRSAQRRIVGESRAIRGVLRMIQSIAPSSASVLICGESGTGKELVAESIHINSPRAEQPFVVVNCANLQENLLESELFGHRRGAFAGAVADKRGLVEIANGGTLFIGEAAEMSPAIQGKMLRVLERGEFRRLGGTEDRTTDIRVVAATNRDLAKEAAAGRFREDLLYRLDVMRIELPPLRERREDIPLIAEHLLRDTPVTAGRTKSLAPDAVAAMAAYDWPGNIRELSNVIERAVILSGSADTIGVEHLLLTPGRTAGPVRTLEALAAVEIDRALALTRGNRTRAAKILGISRQTLVSRLKRRQGTATTDGQPATSNA